MSPAVKFQLAGFQSPVFIVRMISLAGACLHATNSAVSSDKTGTGFKPRRTL